MAQDAFTQVFKIALEVQDPDFSKISKKAAQALEKSFSGSEALTKKLGVMQTTLAQTIVATKLSGLREEEKLTRTLMNYSVEIESLKEARLAHEEKLMKAQAAGDAKTQKMLEKQLADIEKQEKQMLANATKVSGIVRNTLAHKAKKEQEMLDEQQKTYNQIEDFQDAGWMDRISMIKQDLSDALSTAMKGDIKSLFKQIGQGGTKLQAAGGAISAMGTQGAMSGKAAAGAGALVSGVGKLATSLGSLAAPIALLAGSLAGVVALVLAADDQAKRFNRTILNGAGVGDLMYGTHLDGAMKLNKVLGDVRDAAVDLNAVWRWRLTAESQLKILAAANETGFTYKEMESTQQRLINGMQSYGAASELALRYSYLLGVSAEDIAKTMGHWQTDLSLGFKQMEEGFATIAQLAMESGFGMKRFFTMVSQATQGMGLYNARIEQAAKLLALTGKILGENEAAKFLDALGKGFTDKSYTERFKQIIISGQKDVQKIMAKDAKSLGRDFVKNFGGSLDGITVDNVDLGALNADELVKKLGSMSSREQGKLLAQLESQGAEGAAAARKMENLMALSTAATSGNLGDIAKAMPHLSESGKMAALLTSTLGGTPLSEMSAIELAAFEKYAGISGEQLEVLRRTDKVMRGKFDLVRDAVEKGDEETLKKYGLSLDAQDRLVDGNGDIVDNVEAFVMSLADQQVSVEKAALEQEQAALAAVSESKKITDVLQGGVEFILEKIYKLLSSFFSKDFTPEQKALQEKVVGEETTKLESLVTESQNNQAALTEASKKLGQGTDEERAKAAEELQFLEDRGKLLDEQIKAQSSYLSRIETQVTGFDSEQDLRVSSLTPEQRAAYDKKKEAADAEAPLATKNRTFGISLLEDFTAKTLGLGTTREEYASLQGGQANKIKGLAATVVTGNTASDTRESPVEESLIENTEAVSGASEAELDQSEDFRKKEKTELVGQTKKLIDELPGKFAKEIKEDEDKRKLFDTAVADLGLSIEEQKAYLTGGKGFGAVEQKMLAGGYADLATSSTDSPVEDFIYRGGARGGIITPIDQADQFFGAKPGGAIDKAMSGAGSNNVTIHINGGDTAKIYDTVKRALQNSGVRP